MKTKYLFVISTIAALLMSSSNVYANPTKVGNGDDGGDLEKLEKVTSGILQTTRIKAIKKLEALNVRSVSKLGNLVDEVKKTDIYLVKDNKVQAHKFDRGFESSKDGKKVYARTFAKPHAATRFFPDSMLLSENQLVALHIHEALHRTLPESVRENEAIVTEITLAISGPDASRDLISQKMASLVSPAQQYLSSPQRAAMSTRLIEKPFTKRIQNPSEFTYGFNYFQGTDESDFKEVRSMHVLKSYMHPFGGANEAIGLGIALSYLNLDDKSYLGPVKLSGRMNLATWRKFDVEAFAEHSMYTLSDEELKDLPLARDVTTLGIAMSREAKNFYVRNYVSISPESDTDEQVGAIKYVHTYGDVWNINIAAGVKYKNFLLGGKGDLLLAKAYTLSGNDGFNFDSGRYRIVKVGPEVKYQSDNMTLSIFAQRIIDSTPGVNLDYLGDVFGHGAGQGYVGSSFSVTF